MSKITKLLLKYFLHLLTLSFILLDGTLVGQGTVFPGTGIYTDNDEDYVFYADPISGVLNRADPDGSNTITIASGPFEHVTGDVTTGEIVASRLDGSVVLLTQSAGDPDVYDQSTLPAITPGARDISYAGGILFVVESDGNFLANGVDGGDNMMDVDAMVNFFGLVDVAVVNESGEIAIDDDFGNGTGFIQAEVLSGTEHIAFDSDAGTIATANVNGEIGVFESGQYTVLGNESDIEDLVYNSDTEEYAVSNGQAVLPIKLASFDAVQGEGGLDVQWETTQEINNDYFTVTLKHAKTGTTATFDIPAHYDGNVSTAQNYTFFISDEDLQRELGEICSGLSAGLSQTDKDGRFEHFTPVTVAYQSDAPLRIADNVTYNAIQLVDGCGLDDLQSVTVFNIHTGQVFEMHVLPDKSIDVSTKVSGHYGIISPSASDTPQNGIRVAVLRFVNF